MGPQESRAEFGNVFWNMNTENMSVLKRIINILNVFLWGKTTQAKVRSLSQSPRYKYQIDYLKKKILFFSFSAVTGGELLTMTTFLPPS